MSVLQLPKGHLSLSQVREYLACPKRYYAKYVLQRQAPVAQEMYLGGAFHKGQEAYFKETLRGARPRVADVSDFFAMFFNQGWPDEEGRENLPDVVEWEQPQAQLFDLGQELSTLYTEKIGQHLVPMEVEMSFSRKTAGLQVPVVGRIDLVEGTAGTLIDWKVKARRFSPNELISDLQPSFYAFGVGGPVNFSFHLALKTKVPAVEKMPTTRGNGAIAMVTEIVEGVAQAISKGDFPMNPTPWMCNASCPIWSECVGKYRSN